MGGGNNLIDGATKHGVADKLLLAPNMHLMHINPTNLHLIHIIPTNLQTVL